VQTRKLKNNILLPQLDQMGANIFGILFLAPTESKTIGTRGRRCDKYLVPSRGIRISADKNGG